MERFIIGICGGTGSGKTTLAEKIYQAFDGDASLIGMDCYYKDHPELTYDERTKINYDHPNAFETDLLISHIKTLKNGGNILCPIYDYAEHRRAAGTQRVESRRIIIVEGILLFENADLADLFDMKIFVDTDADVRIVRRMARDVKMRGRSLDSVISQYLNTVKPMHEQFVEPYKRRADVIVPEGGHNEVALNMIIDAISRKMKL